MAAGKERMIEMKNPPSGYQAGLLLSGNATQYSKFCSNTPFPVLDLVCQAQAWDLPTQELA